MSSTFPSEKVGRENVFSMGPLAKRSWHEWPKKHLVGLLGSLWYKMSRSDDSNTTWKQLKHVIHGALGIVWDGKFDKATETGWMVTWRGAAVLEGWGDRAMACFQLGTAQTAWEAMNYWYDPYVMLSNPLRGVHCKFVTALGERALFWTYRGPQLYQRARSPQLRLTCFPCERRGYR